MKLKLTLQQQRKAEWVAEKARIEALRAKYPKTGYYVNDVFVTASATLLWNSLGTLPSANWPRIIWNSGMITCATRRTLQWSMWMETNPQAKAILNRFWGTGLPKLNGPETVKALIEADCDNDLVEYFRNNLRRYYGSI